MEINIVELIKAASASQLALAAFLAIASAGLAYYFFKDAPVQTRLMVFFAILGVAFVVIILILRPNLGAGGASAAESQHSVQAGAPPGAGQVPLDKLITVLRSLPPERRLSLCEILGGSAQCPAIVEAISDLPALAASPMANSTIATVNDTGHAPGRQVLAQAAAAVVGDATRVLALGSGSQMKVDVFWCEGANGPVLRSVADRLAAGLADVSGKPLPGSDVVVGRVRSRMLALGLQNQGYPGSGLLLRHEASERHAATAIADYVRQSFGVTLTRAEISYPTKDYVSAFICSEPG